MAKVLSRVGLDADPSWAEQSASNKILSQNSAQTGFAWESGNRVRKGLMQDGNNIEWKDMSFLNTVVTNSATIDLLASYNSYYRMDMSGNIVRTSVGNTALYGPRSISIYSTTAQRLYLTLTRHVTLGIVGFCVAQDGNTPTSTLNIGMHTYDNEAIQFMFLAEGIYWPNPDNILTHDNLAAPGYIITQTSNYPGYYAETTARGITFCGMPYTMAYYVSLEVMAPQLNSDVYTLYLGNNTTSKTSAITGTDPGNALKIQIPNRIGEPNFPRAGSVIGAVYNNIPLCFYGTNFGKFAPVSGSTTGYGIGTGTYADKTLGTICCSDPYNAMPLRRFQQASVTNTYNNILENSCIAVGGNF